MKFVHPEIETVFDTDCDRVNTLIIENQQLFTKLQMDLYEQISGLDGKAVLSDNGKMLGFSGFSELLNQFVPFKLNIKTIQAKVIASFEKLAVNEEYYRLTEEVLKNIEIYLYNVSQSLNCDLNFTKLNISSLTKLAGFEFNEDYNLLGEKIIDYFELVTEFDRKKLFFTVNLRSYLKDEESEMFMDTVLKHGYDLIMIEASEHQLLKKEKRVIIDASLCEIK